MAKKTVTDLVLKGKRVLIRVDFNVPIQQGVIQDDTRIQAALPTIKYVLDQGGLPILMSHLGRPKGEVRPEFSLRPCGEHLSSLLNLPVTMAFDCVGSTIEEQSHLPKDHVLLLENLRFHAAEEKPDLDPDFAKNLAALGDVFVNDAFGTAHRRHSSTVEVARYFPGQAAAGFLMGKEISFLEKAVQNPSHPFVAIVGGAKVSDKLGVLKTLVEKADIVLIGGAMAFTFLKARGLEVGFSLFEKELCPTCLEIEKKAKEEECLLLLPEDVVVARTIDAHEGREIAMKEGIERGWMGVDVGPKTLTHWFEKLDGAALILWNGPLGVFENPAFANGTFEMAKRVSSSKAVSIVGGGDSVAAVKQTGAAKGISHLSTGGGASLEYIEHGSLPGIEALSDK